MEKETVYESPLIEIMLVHPGSIICISSNSETEGYDNIDGNNLFQ